MKTKEYKINDNGFIMTENYLYSENAYFLNDKPRVVSQKEMLQDYFGVVYKVFLKRLEKFKELQQPISAKENSRLLSMLKTLFEVKNTIYGDNSEENIPDRV